MTTHLTMDTIEELVRLIPCGLDYKAMTINIFWRIGWSTCCSLRTIVGMNRIIRTLTQIYAPCTDEVYAFVHFKNKWSIPHWSWNDLNGWSIVVFTLGSSSRRTNNLWKLFFVRFALVGSHLQVMMILFQCCCTVYIYTIILVCSSHKSLGKYSLMVVTLSRTAMVARSAIWK